MDTPAIPRPVHGSATGELQEVVTDSISLATFLALRGHAVSVRVKESDPSSCIFAFPRTPGVLEDQNGFASADAKELRAYERTRNDLTKRIKEAKRGASQ